MWPFNTNVGPLIGLLWGWNEVGRPDDKIVVTKFAIRTPRLITCHPSPYLPLALHIAPWGGGVVCRGGVAPLPHEGLARGHGLGPGSCSGCRWGRGR